MTHPSSVSRVEAVEGAAITVPSIADLFLDPRTLPTPPVAVLEIMRSADDPDVVLADIVSMIESELSIAVQVLRMANSALYSPAKEITTIARAMTTLGLRTIRLLALTTSLRALVPQDASGIDTTEIRQRMVINGAMARRVALLVDPPARDEALLAGLLTGIGPVVLADRAPHVCRRLLDPAGRWPGPEPERELLGYTSDDVTVTLISNWGLPPIFADAIGQRNNTIDAADTPVVFSLKTALLMERVLLGRDGEAALPALRSALGATTELSADQVDEWLVESESVVDETAQLLQFRIPQSVGYQDLLTETTERIHSLQESMDQQLFLGQAETGDLVRRNNELEVEVATDPLTQLPNRRAFDDRLSELLIAGSGGRSCGRGLGMLMLDLDRFKAVNDTHGHAAGDDVLRLVGALLLQQTRGDDFAARLGGEEFVMLIPDTTHEALFAIAERLRRAVADLALPLDTGDVVKVTTSIGGSLVDGELAASSARDLLERTDQQLYNAKRRGRNCTSIGDR